MADPLSIAASIAGLLSLAGPILAEGYAYIASVRNSPNALKQLLSEISRLEAVLGQIDELAGESRTNTGALVQTQTSRVSEVITADTIETASDLLKSVQSSIKQCERIPGQNAKNIGRAIVWPFKEREVKENLDRFERLINTFELALSIESSHLLRNINKRTLTILDEQQDAKRQKLPWDNEFKKCQQGLVMDVHNNLIVGKETLGVARVTYRAVTGNSEAIMRLDVETKAAKQEKLLAMLSPLGPPKRHQDLQAKRYKGSVLWLLEHERFCVWQDSRIRIENTTNRIQHCYGIPGAGKTIVSSMVIDHLLSHYGEQRVAYIYCDYRDKTSQNLLNIMGSILKQHLAVTANIPEPVVSLLESLQKIGKNVMIKDISQMLKFAVPQLDHFLCIDALDELEPGTRLELLKALKTDFGGTRIFLTGRPHISSEVSRILQVHPADAIMITPNLIEVRAYLSHEIELDCEMNPDDMNEQLKEEIIEGIAANTQGMFLLPALHISMVLEQTTMAKRRKALSTLPSELNDAYARMVDRIQNSSRLSDLGMRVLMWLHLARRPLRVDEIQHAIAVEHGDTALDEEAIPAQKRLLDCCLGLVLVDEETSTIRLVHYTLEEYFRTHSSTTFPQGYSMAAKICLTYLNFGELSVECKTHLDMMQQSERFHFLEYASCNWGHYAALAQSQGRSAVNAEALGELALKVLLNKSGRLPHIALQLLYFHITGAHKRSSWDHERSQQLLGIHAAAYFGLETYISVLGNAQGWSMQAAYGRSPLSFAASEGHEAVVRLFVDREGADADSRDTDGRTPLSWAAERGHEAVVRLLVDREGVDADSQDKNGQTPLSWAAERGHEAVVRLLVDREGVDADSQNKNGRTPLSWAAEKGHEAVVRLLVDRERVGVDAKDTYYGQTPLSWAAEKGHEAVVRLLVDTEGVDADAKDTYYGQTPLSWAAGKGHEAVARLLVDRAGVDADSKDTYSGRTPLSWAAEEGHEAVVRLLVGRDGVDADSRNQNGRTPLSWAAEKGHEAVVRLLLDQEGVDGDSKDNYGRTPLSWAAGIGHEAVVQLLVDREGVDADAKDTYYGQTPLSWAAEKGHEAVVRLLVDQEGVDADSKDNYGRTPLSWAARKGLQAVVRLLVGHEGVDADSQNKDGRTPLSWAAEKGHEAVVRLLLDRVGVDAGSKDNYGRTPLSWAAERGHEAVVRLLVDWEGVNADSQDTDGRTPLSWAAERGQEDVVRLLVDRVGVDADSKDKNGRAPLSWAAEGGHKAVVQLLIMRADVDVISVDKDGQTPLTRAVAAGYKAALVQQLLRAYLSSEVIKC